MGDAAAAAEGQEVDESGEPLVKKTRVTPNGTILVPGGDYKRRMCKYYEQGYCSKGDDCTFAHGILDIIMEQPQARNLQLKLNESAGPGADAPTGGGSFEQ